MSVKNLRLCVALLVFALGAARSSSADPVVIYSNFGPSPGYLPQGDPCPRACPGMGWGTSEENGYFMGFQLAEAALLRSVTLPVAWAGNQPIDFSVSIYSSSGNALGGLIERMVVPFPADVQARTITMLTLSSSLQPLLSANTLYFIFAIPAGTRPSWTFGSLWPWNNAGIQGTVLDISPGGRFAIQGTLGAFQLNGEPSPAPEPASMLLFATGAGLILQRVRGRRRV